MIVGVLKEVKKLEGRIALIPENARELTAVGHQVLIQKDAGLISGFSNEDFQSAGAEIVETTKELIDRSDMVCKVKEPTIEEVKMMRPGQIFWGYLHLAPMPELTQAILDQKIVALAFETVELADRTLPLLAPMSEVAGRLATQNGADGLRFDRGGCGVLIGGTNTVDPAHTVVLGAGVVGRNAADVAIGMGSKTTIVDLNADRMELLKKIYGDKIETVMSTKENIERLVKEADLLVGSILIAGEKATKLVTEDMVKTMKKGSVIIDVSVDQGGCVETSEVTTHDKPFLEKHGVLHYGVANMPGSVPRTSTLALNNATFKYTKAIAELGLEGVMAKYPEMKGAVNCANGEIVHDALKGIL